MGALSPGFEKRVLDKCDAYRRCHLWVPSPHLKPESWLANFQAPDEREIALVLLDHFLFYSDIATNALLKSNYGTLIDDAHQTPSLKKLVSRDECVFTRVEGEHPNPTDSGYLFCRKARDVLGVPESNIVEPKRALELGQQGHPIVFLDDFVGSGDQMIGTWKRKYSENGPQSFEQAMKTKGIVAVYLTLIATLEGLQRVQFDAPELHVRASHVIGQEYSARLLDRLPHNSTIPNLADRIHNLLQTHAKRLNLQDYMCKADFPLYGYRSLGLLVGFQHGIPDATLPIFWATADSSWAPLVTRKSQ